MSKPVQRFSSSLLPMGDQWLGSRIHPWQTAYVHDAEIRGDAWIQGDIHTNGNMYTTFLYTDWIFSDAPIHVPKGIIADTVLGGDMVCKKTVADLTIAKDGLFGNVLVDRNVGHLADARTITNTTPLLDALTMVESLQGIRFMQHGKSRIGMVADQVAPHVPEAVMTSAHPESYKYLLYETLVPLLIESIKTLAARVKTLEESLDAESTN